MDKETCGSPVKTIDDSTLDVSVSVENATTIVDASSGTSPSMETEGGVTPSPVSTPSTPSQRGGGSVKNFLQSTKEKWNNVPQGWMQSRKEDN